MSRRRSTLVLFVALVAALSLPAQARAHAGLERSSPGDGTRVAKSPSMLRLWFGEEVSSRFRVVRVLDEKGRPVGPVTLTGEGRLVAADLPTLGRGAYVVYWRVLSLEDGHATEGTLSFGVGGGPAPVPATVRGRGPSFSWLEAALRWLDFAFLAGVVGSLIVGALVLPRARDADARGVRLAGARVLRVGVWCALLAAGSGVARLGYEVFQLPGPGAGFRSDAASDLLLRSRWGWMWLAREASLLAVAALLVSHRSLPIAHGLRARWRWGAAAVGVGLAGGAHAMTSHASSLEPSSVTAVVAEGAHVLAAGAWLGSVAALAAALWPAGSLSRPEARALAGACRGPFAECMALSVGLVLATGLYSAGREVTSVDGLMTTTYGHVLLIKVGIVLAAGTLGGANFLLLCALGRRRTGRVRGLAASRTALLAEATAGAGVFLAAAVLASSVPARGPQFAPPLPARVATQSVTSGDLVFSVSSTPTRAGVNTLSVLAASSRRPPPAPIDAVSLELSRRGVAKTVRLTRVEPERYLAAADLEEPGQWRLVIVAERAGEQIRAPLAWSFDPRDPARPVSYSARALAPLVDAAAGLMFGLTLLGAAWILAGRPRLHLARVRSSAAESIPGEIP